MTPTVEVPQLGPLLGRLSAPAPWPREAPALTDLRHGFVDALFERSGVARDLLACGDVDGAQAALARVTWLSAWREVATRVADAVLAETEDALRRAAIESRFPRRQLEGLRWTAADVERLRARCDAAGIPIERAQGTANLAAATEEAWGALATVVNEERATRLALALRIRRWHRPRRPLWIMTGAAVGAAILTGGWIGGYVPAPAWIRPMIDWWWGLPWP